MKKTTLALSLILALLFSAVAGTQLVNLGKTNPFSQWGPGPLKSGTPPLIVSISSPENNSLIPTSNVSLSFNWSQAESPIMLSMSAVAVYYEADWKQNATEVFDFWDDYADLTICNLTGIPEGNHTIIVHAIKRIFYAPMSYTGRWAEISGSASVNFVIDTIPPEVSMLSAENKTYGTSDIPLSFSLNEPTSQITFSLDGQDNVTVAGNQTLTGLSNGKHNLTVYAQDMEGNTGVSETIYFTIEEPFPSTLVILTASAAVVGAGLFVYFRKRKKS